MKKLIIPLLLSLVLAGCSQDRARYNEFQNITHSFTTPEEIANWMKNNFTYQSEKIENWKSPYETYKDSGGDCEDLSIYFLYCLKENSIGKERWFVIKDLGKRGHSFIVFLYLEQRTDNCYVYRFDNFYLKKTVYNTISQFKKSHKTKHLYFEWKELRIGHNIRFKL